jgi:hypothetical protein
MFRAFEVGEVEGIRTVVLVGHQGNDTLLSNCSTRSLPEIRAFIRRYKADLVDGHKSTPDIAKMANENYLAILAGVRQKRMDKQFQMSSAMSTTNFSMNQTVPFKFCTRLGCLDALPPRPCPPRSVSVPDALFVPAPIVIEVLPSFFDSTTSPTHCANIRPGRLALVYTTQNITFPSAICRILAVTTIDGTDYALVAFFQAAVKPCYVSFADIHLIPEHPNVKMTEFTVDGLIHECLQQSVCILICAHPQMKTSATSQETSRLIFRMAIEYALQILLVAFASNYRVPEPKTKLLIDGTTNLWEVQFRSTQIINERSVAMITHVLDVLAKI